VGPRAAGQLTWLVYIIGSVIGARNGSTVLDEHQDTFDAELICRYNPGCLQMAVTVAEARITPRHALVQVPEADEHD
jgi:hypothetical protein